MDRKTPHGFQIVRNVPLRSDVPEIQNNGIQQALFPWPTSRLLIFVEFSKITDDQFVSVLENARPVYVFELRRAPRFDIGRLNRKMAFKAFDQTKSTYLDFTTAEKREVFQMLRDVAGKLRNGAQSQRPVMFLVNSTSQFDECLLKEIIDVFEVHREHWDVMSLPDMCETSKAAG
jgi:hypothetical protein